MMHSISPCRIFITAAYVHFISPTSSYIVVMAASTIPVFAEENLGTPIDIRVDVIHLELVVQLLSLTIKEDEDNSKEKRLKDVPIIRDFLEVFPEDLPGQGIHVDLAKIKSIKDWASSKTPTKIRQSLDLARYYRRFIERFSKIAKLMTKLTQKKVAFE
ncbi:hypothetical protein Tco_0060471 [Tanacetum coccineum]